LGRRDELRALDHGKSSGKTAFQLHQERRRSS
jgi:hypothetical protein